MDLPIFKASTVKDYVTYGLATLPFDKKIKMIDTNGFTYLKNVISNNEESYSDLLKVMFEENTVVIIPEIILEECERNLRMRPTGAEDYEEIYAPVFQALNQYVELYIASFEDMEKIILGNNGNEKALSLSLAKVILEELFSLNTAFRLKLIDLASFEEIEAILIEEQKDAGERVIVFFAMLLLADFREVDVLTNEVAVYTQRYVIGKQDRLLEAIGVTDNSVFFEFYNLKSFDFFIYKVLLQNHITWDTRENHSFIENVRDNRPRKVRAYLPTPTNYTYDSTVKNNQEFEELCAEFIEKSAHFLF